MSNIGSEGGQIDPETSNDVERLEKYILEYQEKDMSKVQKKCLLSLESMLDGSDDEEIQYYAEPDILIGVPQTIPTATHLYKCLVREVLYQITYRNQRFYSKQGSMANSEPFQNVDLVIISENEQDMTFEIPNLNKFQEMDAGMLSEGDEGVIQYKQDTIHSIKTQNLIVEVITTANTKMSDMYGDVAIAIFKLFRLYFSYHISHSREIEVREGRELQSEYYNEKNNHIQYLLVVYCHELQENGVVQKINQVVEDIRFKLQDQNLIKAFHTFLLNDCLLQIQPSVEQPLYDQSQDKFDLCLKGFKYLKNQQEKFQNEMKVIISQELTDIKVRLANIEKETGRITEVVQKVQNHQQQTIKIKNLIPTLSEEK